MIREDHVCSLAHANVRLEAALSERVDLLEQRFGVDHAAVPENTDFPPNCTGGDEREFVLRSVVNDGVSSVVAALIPGDHVDGVAVDIDDTALAFVAELRPDDCDGHNSGGFLPGR